MKQVIWLITIHLVIILIKAKTQQTSNNGSSSSGNGDVAPKVHRIFYRSKPVIIPGRDFYEPSAMLVLECEASGTPSPIIQWSFNNMKFVAGRNLDGTDGGDKVRHELSGNELIIRKIKNYNESTGENDDNGRYRCIATNRVGSVFHEKYIKVGVLGQFLPQHRKNSDPQLFFPVIGKSFSISCPPHTKGHGTYIRWGFFPRYHHMPTIWWRPGDPYKNVFPDYNTGTLHWSVVTVDDLKISRDIGGIRCVLINDWHIKFSNQQRLWERAGVENVRRKPEIVTPIPSIMNITEGDEYAIVCGATGNPVPDITWEYQGVTVKSRFEGSEELNFEFFRLMGKKNQELRIGRITEYSGGTFKCFAKNSEGQAYSKGQLIVQFPPKWINKFPDVIDLPIGNDFVLVCNATGTPRITFTWYQDGVMMKNNSSACRKGISGEKSQVLTIKNTKMEDGGIYICEAENEFDIITQSVFIRVGTV